MPEVMQLEGGQLVVRLNSAREYQGWPGNQTSDSGAHVLNQCLWCFGYPV